MAYSAFYLQESMGPDVGTLDWPDGDIDGPVVTSGDGGVFLRSAGNDHYPAVRLELWSEPRRVAARHGMSPWKPRSR